MNNKKPATIMKHYRKNVHYKDAMLDVVTTEIQKEINSLVRKDGDVLQNKNTESLLNHDWTAISEKFQVKAPYLYSIFCNAANLYLGSKKKLPSMITSAAILLYTRSERVNQLQYIKGLMADKCGLTKEVMCYQRLHTCKINIIKIIF